MKPTKKLASIGTQIDIDVQGNVLPYHTATVVEKCSLKQILWGLAYFCPEVGYTQGMSCITSLSTRNVCLHLLSDMVGVAMVILLHGYEANQVFWIMLVIFKRYGTAFNPREAMQSAKTFENVMKRRVPHLAELLLAKGPRDDNTFWQLMDDTFVNFAMHLVTQNVGRQVMDALLASRPARVADVVYSMFVALAPAIGQIPDSELSPRALESLISGMPALEVTAAPKLVQTDWAPGAAAETVGEILTHLSPVSIFLIGNFMTTNCLPIVQKRYGPNRIGPPASRPQLLREPNRRGFVSLASYFVGACHHHAYYWVLPRNGCNGAHNPLPRLFGG